MALKIVLLLAVVALAYGWPASQSSHDIKEISSEVVENYLAGLAAQAAKDGDNHSAGQLNSGVSSDPMMRALQVSCYMATFIDGKLVQSYNCPQNSPNFQSDFQSKFPPLMIPYMPHQM